MSRTPEVEAAIIRAYNNDGATVTWNARTLAAEVERLEAALAGATTVYLHQNAQVLKATQRAETAEARAERLTKSLLAHDAERTLYLRRLLWLHDCSTGTTDADGCEWGIYRVKWVNGQAAEVWQTNSDFSDLDAAMERDGYKLPASAKALEARVKELEAELKYGTATGEPCAEVVRLTEHNAKLRAALQYAGMKAGTANALAYHAEQGKDNGGVERTALAEWLRALAKDLKAVEAALADTKGTT